MDEVRQRIQDDLRGLLEGTVQADDVTLQLYATDASIYQIRPLAVICPRSVADVVAVVGYAGDNQLPIHARGAGTGLAGESLGPGLVLDFSRFMRRLVSVDDTSVRVQPGLVLERLNQQLRAQERCFGPDPAMSHVTTMGSVIAIDAAGSHWLRWGSARRHIRSLQVVLADGSLLEVGREPVDVEISGGASARKRALVADLSDVLARHADQIKRQPTRSLVNRSGYALGGVLADGQLDVAKLLCGSEGTLALVTEATLDIQPLARQRGVALLFFDRLEAAARAVSEIVPLGPSACDLMDRRHLSLAREHEPRFEKLIPGNAEAVLIVEQQADTAAEVRDGLRRMIDQTRRRRLAFDARQAFDRDDVELFWQLAHRVVPTLYRLRGSSRAVPFVEDIAVPPDALPGFLTEMQNVLKRHLVTASLYGHAGHGQLHLRPFLDLADPASLVTMRHLASDLYDSVLAVGGTISGEHGTGLSRTSFVRRQYGELCEVFTEIKRVFDPRNLLNPGKVIGDDPELLTKNLRPLPMSSAVVAVPPVEAPGTVPTAVELATDLVTAAPAAPRVVELQLAWNIEQLGEVAGACNGCGSCRSQAPEVRMCPIFRYAPAEEASPRAKANLLRGVISGQLPADTLATHEAKAVADLCVHCHQCRLECPANVDIPRLMLEAKASFVATHGLQFRDWVFARIDAVSALGHRFAPLVNRLVGNRQARWLAERLLGIARARKVPRFARQTFLQRARRRGLTRPTRRTGPKVLYFVDTYANYHDPQLADALVAVFEHNTVAVYVHPEQRASGMSLIAAGALEQARDLATHHVRLLAEAVRQGFSIVATEPAAALALTWEYPALLNDEDSRLVADNTSEACAFLAGLHRQGKLALDLAPVNASVGYHQPCHLRALGVGTPGESLLRLIPALRLQRIDKGCSGMAGTFGLRQENFRNSLRAGIGLISAVRDRAIQVGTTECSACKLQMEQGTSKPTIHPLKLLALSYGLMPEVATLLSRRSGELVVT
ncbi:MAG: anaerobic glycerol-3-phosphate dehydrogenase subunit C [Pirellulales bacterium]|nr:anaerobic glycerol-3-phosphate dehydrogenase subunit C [Pirellulales bacterium]